MNRVDEQWPEQAISPEDAQAEQEPVDIVALVAAVERLLRRDLELDRERFGGKARRRFL